MDKSQQISDEYDRLINLENKELETELGSKISRVHLGKDAAVIMHLIKKYGIDDVSRSIQSGWWCK